MSQSSQSGSSSIGCFGLSYLSALIIFSIVNIGRNPGLSWLGLALVGAFFAPRAVRHIRMTRYFASEEFQTQKAEIAEVVREHNEMAGYAAEIREKGLFELGSSSTGAQSHLATTENMSQHNYRRDRNVADLAAPNVHNCSLQVVRNASSDPLKYLMKYFDIRANEATLERVEALGESIGSLEGAIENLRERENSITHAIRPPDFILEHYRTRFMEEVGVDLDPITVPYPQYIFEYVSAGGNSAQRTTVNLDGETIDALIQTLSAKIKFQKSAAGQRALMTSKLRESIKERDGYTCQTCTVSIEQEPHLLLEVDHIKPVSRGGLSTPENLQALCWRCNRTKSNKMPA